MEPGLYKNPTTVGATHSASDNKAPSFLEVWLAEAWFFAYDVITVLVARLENVRQSTIRRDKRPGF